MKRVSIEYEYALVPTMHRAEDNLLVIWNNLNCLLSRGDSN